jgi:HSP20 family protein
MAGPANRSGNHATMQNVAFTRWDPLRDLIALHDQIGQLVGHDAPGWTPPVDLYETSHAFILTAELPGLARDQIEIHAEENRIVIRGERSSHVPCEQYHRVERGHGPFSRAFVLPDPIDVEAVTADLTEGLLTLTLPKAGGRGARRVDVS